MNSYENQNLAIDMQNVSTKLWSMQYINILLINLIINIASMILINILPLYAMSLGGNNFIAGLIMTIFTLAALMFRPVFGKMLDTKGRRVVLILGLILFSLSSILLLLSTNIILLLLLRFIQGIGLSAYSTSLGTILSDVVPMSRISEGVGYFGISGTISMAIGPSLGLYLYSQFNYQITYIVTFIIAGCSIIFAYLINYEKKKKNILEGNFVHQQSVDMTDKSNNQKKGFIEKTSIRPCLVMFFTVISISSVFSFMPIFGETRNIDNIGLFFTAYAISVILSRILTGKIADRYGFYRVFLPSIIITIMMFITLAFAYSLPIVLLAAVFYGVGYGTLQPIMNAIVIKLSPPERRGSANATYYATMDISFGLGSIVWGAASQYLGFTAVFLACAASVAISLVMYYLILHRLILNPGDSFHTN